jgi:hypothetical protein
MSPKYKLRWARGEFRLPWVLGHTLKKTENRDLSRVWIDKDLNAIPWFTQ